MNDRQRGASLAPERHEAPHSEPVTAQEESAADEKPLTPLRPLMMMSDEKAGFCTGDACLIPVRNNRGEGQ